VAVAQVLLGETPAELPPLQASETATEVVYEVAKMQSKYWRCLDVKGCEPPEVSAVGDISLKTSVPGQSRCASRP
jgi:histone deacetylase 6